MQYEKSVSRAEPGCVIFLVDQSYSMLDGIAGAPRSKAEAVATALNRFFQTIIADCERGEELPRNYFEVGAIGYTTDRSNRPVVRSLFEGPLVGRDLVTIVELYENPLSIETRTRHEDDGAGGLIEREVKFPVWYRPPSPDEMVGTPTCAALEHCYNIARGWCQVHPDSFPPIIIHLTDGDPTDGEPEEIASRLRRLSTSDGELLLFNCHLSHQQADPILFPHTERQLPDEFSRMLFQMSSEMPKRLRHRAELKGLSVPPGARGMAFNADSTRMLLLINAGTITAERE